MAGYLPGKALDLFRAMPRYDQLHAVRVARALVADGWLDRDLLAAALLHDAGKTVALPEPGGRRPAAGGRVGIWHRVAVVVMQAGCPGLLARLGRGEEAAPWLRAFHVQRHHAAIGAELATRAGCSARTASLIRWHEGPRESEDTPGREADPLLPLLRAADSQN